MMERKEVFDCPTLPQVFPAKKTMRSNTNGGGDLWDLVLLCK